jgi:hypothetical protein
MLICMTYDSSLIHLIAFSRFKAMAANKKSTTGKTKKEIFEEQLRALQEDISALSQNLSLQKTPTTTYHSGKRSL